MVLLFAENPLKGDFEMSWAAMRKVTKWRGQQLIAFKSDNPRDPLKSLQRLCRKKICKKINKRETFLKIGSTRCLASKSALNIYYACDCNCKARIKVRCELLGIRRNQPALFQLIKPERCDCGENKVFSLLK